MSNLPAVKVAAVLESNGTTFFLRFISVFYVFRLPSSVLFKKEFMEPMDTSETQLTPVRSFFSKSVLFFTTFWCSFHLFFSICFLFSCFCFSLIFYLLQKKEFFPIWFFFYSLFFFLSVSFFLIRLVIISFRGSESLENWLHDFDFLLTNYPGKMTRKKTNKKSTQKGKIFFETNRVGKESRKIKRDSRKKTSKIEKDKKNENKKFNKRRKRNERSEKRKQ